MRRHGHKKGKRVRRSPSKARAIWQSRKLRDLRNWGYSKTDPLCLPLLWANATKPVNEPGRDRGLKGKPKLKVGDPDPWALE